MINKWYAMIAIFMNSHTFRVFKIILAIELKKHIFILYIKTQMFKINIVKDWHVDRAYSILNPCYVGENVSCLPHPT